ncbi:MAG: catalase [Vicinamibacterales bacterium]
MPSRKTTPPSRAAKARAKTTSRTSTRTSKPESAGGATHQVASGRDAVLTTNQGIPIADNQNQLTAGQRGPVLLQDFVFREKMFHFDHERIPERIVHARGSAAHGYFELTESLADVTRADLFQRPGQRTPVFARFSTVAGGAGSVDTPRDVRGFAVKFYTREGNWDLVGNNIPVFLIQDAIKFPDLIHAVKMEADRGYPQAATAHDTFWDFVSLMPESTHMVLWAMSDRTLPRSLRMMEGFGIHTFRFLDAQGRSSFVKFHWKPRLGLQSTVWDEAVKIAGADPDYHRRDLFESIARGAFPEWDLGVQLFDEAMAERLPFDVLDATKLIPEEVVPVRIVGRMVLDRNPDNFFAETEQVAFCPANVPPGIDFSNDPLLQGRLFSYLDTQLSRLGGPNFHQIPINAPKGCPFHNFQRDGHMQTAVPSGRANYEPNSLSALGEDGGPRESPDRGFPTAAARVEGDTLRVRPESFADHYSQARLFYRSLQPVEQAHVRAAFVFELSKVTAAHVRERVVGNVRNVDEPLAAGIAEGLGMALPPPSPAARPPIDMEPSPVLSIAGRMPDTLEGRTVGILVADGSDADLVKQLIARVTKAGAHPMVIAPRVAGLAFDDGSVAEADGQLAGTPSVLVDAVALVLSEDAGRELSGNPVAVQFVADAYHHLKAIGHTAGAAPLLDAAHVVADEGVCPLPGKAFLEAAPRRFFSREPQPAVEPTPARTAQERKRTPARKPARRR